MSWSTLHDRETLRRCARIGCSNTFVASGRKAHQKYCSSRCRGAEHHMRIYGTRLRKGPGRRLEKFRCHNGHERTPENTTRHSKTGAMVCRDCQRAAMKRYRARKAAA